MKKRILSAGAGLLLLCGMAACSEVSEYDVVIVGGGTSGVAAGLQSARLGARTLIVEEFDWLGGMLTSAGVSATDGNYVLRGGIWDEFRTELEHHYGGPDSLCTGWVSKTMFEPSVGDSLFKCMVAREPNLEVCYRATASGFDRRDGVWRLDIDCGGKNERIAARVLIDATELGDVAKELGVPYDVGMDATSETGEKEALDAPNDIVQDLTYVAVLKDYGRDVTIPQPEGYDPAVFACCCINDNCITPKEPDRMWPREMMITYGELPNKKYMINWPIEGNDYYVNMVDMDAAGRAEAVRQAKNHTLCFLYFLQTELGFRTLGLADDEFPTEDLLPFYPYHRESRRIHGLVRFTLNDISDPYANTLYRTTIGVGDYPIDQHHTRYPEWSSLPNLYFHPVPSYGVPMGVMLPAAQPGLIVAEKSISVTNLVNGSTRLQPVVLQIGQAAGALAALAVKENCEPSEVSVRKVQEVILDDGGYLLPYLDLPSTDPRFKAMQRIAATGILRGRGANVGWSNQSWFDAEKRVSEALLRRGLREVYPTVAESSDTTAVCGRSLAAMLSEALGSDATAAIGEKAAALLEGYDAERPLTRLECAQLIDAVADPFHSFGVAIDGRFLRDDGTTAAGSK